MNIHELPLGIALDHEGNPYAPVTATNGVFGKDGENLDIILGRAGLMGLPYCEGNYASRSVTAVASLETFTDLTPVFEKGTNLINGVYLTVSNKGTWALFIGAGNKNVVSNESIRIQLYRGAEILKTWNNKGMNLGVISPSIFAVSECEQGDVFSFSFSSAVALTQTSGTASQRHAFWFGQISDATVGRSIVFRQWSGANGLSVSAQAPTIFTDTNTPVLSRVGQVVVMDIPNEKAAGAITTAQNLWTIPIGFRPTATATSAIVPAAANLRLQVSEASGTARSTVRPTVNIASANNDIRTSMTWITNDSMP